MRPELKPMLTAVLIFTAILCIYALIIDPAPMTIQDQYDKPIGEIYGDITVRQSFVATENQLTRVDIKFATYARKNTGDIIFGLKEASSTQDIVNVTAKAEKIKDNTYHAFSFDPIPESKGKSYEFYIYSPNSVPGNAVTIWHSTKGEYKNGTAFLNNNPIQGDLSFRTYHTHSVLDFISSCLKNFINDAKFSIFYISLLVAVLSAIIWIQVRATKEKKQRIL